MSLTSQLDDAGSPITVFLTTALPDVTNVSAAFHAVRPPDREALCPPVTCASSARGGSPSRREGTFPRGRTSVVMRK